jgi:hypothetical protein
LADDERPGGPAEPEPAEGPEPEPAEATERERAEAPEPEPAEAPESESAEAAEPEPAEAAGVDEPGGAGTPRAEEPAAEARPGGTQEITVEELMAAMREIKIGAFLLQTLSTLASLAYGKLESGDLDEARAAIDAIGALVPVLEGRVEEPVRKDFERALANLRLAYASAAATTGEPEPGP